MALQIINAGPNPADVALIRSFTWLKTSSATISLLSWLSPTTKRREALS